MMKKKRNKPHILIQMLLDDSHEEFMAEQLGGIHQAFFHFLTMDSQQIEILHRGQALDLRLQLVQIIDILGSTETQARFNSFTTRLQLLQWQDIYTFQLHMYQCII